MIALPAAIIAALTADCGHRANRAAVLAATRYIPIIDLHIEPGDFGSQASDQHRPEPTVPSPDIVTPALDRQRSALEDCYRWAYRRGPVPGGTVSVELRLSGLGTVDEVNTQGAVKDGRGLRRCAEDVLSNVWLPYPPGRPIRVHFDIVLIPGNYVAGGQARRPRIRPRLATRHKRAELGGATSMHIPAMPVRAEKPAVGIGYATADRHYSKIDLRRRHQQNIGAYRRCAWAASKSDPLQDQIDIAVTVDDFGTSHAGIVGKPKRANLAACLRRAVEQAWLPVLARGTHPDDRKAPSFVLRFDLSGPRRVPRAAKLPETEESRAARLLAQGDGERASRIYTRLLSQHPGDKKSCTWRANALRADILVRPWLDASILDQLLAVEALASKLALPERRACVALLATDLYQLARSKHSTAQRLGLQHELELARALYDWLLRLQPHSPSHCDQRYYRAEALSALAEAERDGRVAEAEWHEAAQAFAELKSICGPRAR